MELSRVCVCVCVCVCVWSIEFEVRMPGIESKWMLHSYETLGKLLHMFNPECTPWWTEQ